MVSGKELRAMRIKSGLTTGQMAELAGKHLRTYSAYEKGDLRIPNDVYERMVEGIQSLEDEGTLLEAHGEWIRAGEVTRILGVGRTHIYKLVSDFGIETKRKSARVLLFNKEQILAVKKDLFEKCIRVAEAAKYLGLGVVALRGLIRVGILVPLDKPGPILLDRARVDEIKKRLEKEMTQVQVRERLANDGVIVDKGMLFYYLNNQSKIMPHKGALGKKCYQVKDYEAIKKLVEKYQKKD